MKLIRFSRKLAVLTARIRVQPRDKLFEYESKITGAESAIIQLPFSIWQFMSIDMVSLLWNT